MFYAIVYGDSWEDVDYYYSFQQARAKLVLQTRDAALQNLSFHPMLIVYNRDPCSGSYGRTREIYGIPKNKITQLKSYDDMMIKMNPEIAFYLIEYML